MGYPIQPVNQQTADFVLNCFIELAGEIKKQIIPTQNIADFLKKHNTNTNETKAKVSNKLTSKKNDGNIKENPEKPLRVYQRKKPKLTNEDEVPSLKIVVEENDKASCSGAIKDFSITIDGSTNGNAATVLNIPVPVRMDSLLSVVSVNLIFNLNIDLLKFLIILFFSPNNSQEYFFF